MPMVMMMMALALGACSLFTPTQTTQLIQTAETLASVAAKNNTTAANLLAKGALVCGEASSVQGQLVLGGLTVIANAAKVPVSVTGAVQGDVADACKAIGLVAGPMPVNVDPASVPVVVVTAPVVAKLPTT